MIQKINEIQKDLRNMNKSTQFLSEEKAKDIIKDILELLEELKDEDLGFDEL